jgi:hypothetical protein
MAPERLLGDGFAPEKGVSKMTEKDWLQSRDLDLMLGFLAGRDGNLAKRVFSWSGWGSRRTSLRKLRLFACACCRKNLKVMKVAELRHAVETSERFADGEAEWHDLAEAVDRIQRIVPIGEEASTSRLYACAAACAATMFSSSGGRTPFAHAWANLARNLPSNSFIRKGRPDLEQAIVWCHRVAFTEVVVSVMGDDPSGNETSAYIKRESLLRHIIGNPFALNPIPESFPLAVTQMAESLYAGVDCGLPLSDALEELGLIELAEHFREVEWHPKGCWAMDLVLGKS